MTRLSVIKHPLRHESAANPAFQVTSATRNEREMRLMLHSMTLQSDRLERRMAALDITEKRRPKAREPEDEVIDDGDVDDPQPVQVEEQPAEPSQSPEPAP